MNNLDINKVFSNQGGSDNVEMQKHNLNNEIYQDEINHNMEIILNSFKNKANKGPNDTMTKDELLDFLDSNVGVRYYFLKV